MGVISYWLLVIGISYWLLVIRYAVIEEIVWIALGSDTEQVTLVPACPGQEIMNGI